MAALVTPGTPLLSRTLSCTEGAAVQLTLRDAHGYLSSSGHVKSLYVYSFLEIRAFSVLTGKYCHMIGYSALKEVSMRAEDRRTGGLD